MDTVTNVDASPARIAASSSTHQHSVRIQLEANVDHTPQYATLVLAQYTAPVYSPEMNNWRWYADEADETPGTAYANENTAPPQVEMGSRIPLKLRINITNTAGAAEDDSRKVLQYGLTTDQAGAWMNVGEPTDTLWLFRYTTDISGGADNDTLSSKVLSDSDATYRGIHNESNGNSPSNSDHPADKTVEFEYAIENYKAPANITYYFQLYDQILGTYIPLASGKDLPSLTTAAAYSLTVSSPSAVYLGEFEVGSGEYHEYTFVGGEEITNRDNRGLAGGGESNGWTCSAEITTELTDGSDTIPASDMYWISFTTDIVGLYAAPTDGMTGNPGEYMSSAVTAITAPASGRQGLGGFTILPTMRIYNITKTGDYSGAVTFTTI
ncbi:hypothetical protein A2V68_01660 [candidate division Kazan bacterium RBG_13_50_9]|uniref:Uncharacterized protein n=1 Tax=candidate division Kazan bacterium RBG_13_50_9 TaxID=1798535 RepID=A0A1F4NSK5_UNCK3|nr:MAG: hypothetical protein A2V68_01660 [candidate division Kazan bacterium RBG_13_50_9]